ncbi:hypothetical protein C8F04DRAFT_1182891 [Mycena alexandri]|uniref:Uncharacterized protein n=1 Tax=Mycena alexandri TaxID=1745969 RepID=A0AAD6SW49_9AGAR|nr:hypothetical protein C8F04DRAFT_1182891 [Mycena alexandri]
MHHGDSAAPAGYFGVQVPPKINLGGRGRCGGQGTPRGYRWCGGYISGVGWTGRRATAVWRYTTGVGWTGQRATAVWGYTTGGRVDRATSYGGVGVHHGGRVDRAMSYSGAGVHQWGRVDRAMSYGGAGVHQWGRVDRAMSYGGVGVHHCSRVDKAMSYGGVGAYDALLHDVIHPKAILWGLYQVQGTVVHGVQGTVALVRGTGYCCCKDTLQVIYQILVMKNITIWPCKEIALCPYYALLHDVIYPKTHL